jgi:hypothetical protein
MEVRESRIDYVDIVYLYYHTFFSLKSGIPQRAGYARYWGHLCGRAS